MSRYRGNEPATSHSQVIEYPEPGSEIPPENNGGQAGYVVGECGHRVARQEWRAGFRTCERCPS